MLTSALALVAFHITTAHARPPEPEEPLPSNLRSEQLPAVDGPAITAAGVSGAAGAATVRMVAFAARQHVHSE